jgi:hydroxymethylbilane synthase
MVNKIVIGTRGSQLALWQAYFVRDALSRIAPDIVAELKTIKTEGDRDTNAPVAQLSGKGVFIKEIEDALLAGEVDMAVHSMKDVPTQIPEGLTIAAVCEREDVRDAVLCRHNKTLSNLPAGARIGTSSLRRQAQLKHYRPDLEIALLRGNINTRVRKLDEGLYDAILLARAGLVRLGLASRITETLSTDVALPAVAQGAVGVQCRRGDENIVALLGKLNHPITHAAIDAERALLQEMEGGCQVPIGAWARLENGEFVLEACVLSLNGAICLRDRMEGSLSDPASLGKLLAARLLAAGADKILETIRISGGAH